MIVEENDKNKNSNCYVCNKPLKVGQLYEIIVTQRKSEIVVHTDCIKKGCE